MAAVWFFSGLRNIPIQNCRSHLYLNIASSKGTHIERYISNPLLQPLKAKNREELNYYHTI